MSAANDPSVAAVDKALESWRQGDCVLEQQWFAHRFDPQLSLTSGVEGGDGDASLAESEVDGLVVVTQTCDVVRSCADRPYVEVCPLVDVDEEQLHAIERGRYPRYAFVPALRERRLVGDLDRTMVVEKPVVAKWARTPGCATDAEARAFADALARKRKRFAFPDDFTRFAKKLQDRLIKKHDRDSPEGRMLRALREIRAHAAPSWDDATVTVTFWFVRRDGDDDTDEQDWVRQLDEWLKLVPAADRFTKVQGAVVTLDDMTARDYVESDLLDLDHLSGR